MSHPALTIPPATPPSQACAIQAPAAPDARPGPQPHGGMPPFEQDGPPLSFFEFWPMWAFYPPVMAYAAWLMLRHRGVLLPTVANPSFPGGGFYGESKAAILAMAVRHVPEWVAPFVAITRPEAATPVAGPAPGADDAGAECADALAALDRAGLALPVVAKPDLGCRGAGVRLVRTEIGRASCRERVSSPV